VEVSVLDVHNPRKSKQKLDASSEQGCQRLSKYQHFLRHNGLVFNLPYFLGSKSAVAPRPLGSICGNESIHGRSIFVLPNVWCNSRLEIPDKAGDGKLTT